MTNTQKSVTAPEEEIASISESEEQTAEESQEKSLDEIAAEFGIQGFPKETKKTPKQKSQSAEESPQEQEGSEETEASEDATLGELLEKQVEVTFKKQNSKYPDVQDGDIVKNESGTPVIRAKHVYDDMNVIFGIDGKTTPKLETFFLINKHKPEKADVIAKTAGFRSRHHLAAAIEEFREADAEGQAQILEAQFPEWTRYGSGVEAPFLVQIQESNNKQNQEKEVKEAGLPYSTKELSTAIDSYVADNNNITKKDILSSVKLREALVEFSAFQKDGKPISARRALELAIREVGLQRQSLSKTDRMTIGGGGNQPPLPKANKSALTSGLRAIAGEAGINPKEFEEFLRKRSS